MPEVSIILTTYNDVGFIRDAVDSILCQTYTDFEFIIIDDGSTDGTSEVLRKYTDARIRLYRRENAGVAVARRVALEYARGKYFAMQDGDDISLPERLEYEVKFLENHPDVGLVGTSVLMIDEEGRELFPYHFPKEHDAIYQQILTTNCFGGPSLLMRRDIYDRVGGYRDYFKNSEDYDLSLRFLDVSKGHNIRKVLYKRRLNIDSITVTRPTQMHAYHQLASALAKERRAGKVENAGYWREQLIDSKEEVVLSDESMDPQRCSLLKSRYYDLGCIYFYGGNVKQTRILFTRALKLGWSLKILFCLFLVYLPGGVARHFRFIFQNTARLFTGKGIT